MNQDVVKILAEKIVNFADKNIDELIDIITKELVKTGDVPGMPVEILQQVFTRLFKAYQKAIELDWEERFAFANKMDTEMTNDDVLKLMQSPDMQKWMKDMGLKL
jgi:hypothetical protein